MDECAIPPPRADLGNPSLAHASVRRHVLSCIAERRPNFVQIPREAAFSLLGTRFDYFGDGNATEPYASERVSIPKGQQAPVPLSQALDETARKLLTREGILADADVIEWRQANEREGTRTWSLAPIPLCVACFSRDSSGAEFLVFLAQRGLASPRSL